MNIVLRLLFLITLAKANTEQLNKLCQTLQCNSTTEICRQKTNCTEKDLIKCIYCDLKTSQQFNESSYDEYYEYDEDETSDKIEFNDDTDYSEDYIEPINNIVDSSKPVRKLGTCPKVVQATGKCDTEKTLQPDCQFDTDCPGELKCCQAACGRRVCIVPIKPSISLCPTSFQCSLNCRLGYQLDSNGCLKCECQSCPSLDQCNKNCQSGYLKDLFGCDICECNKQCPPFSCNINCPPGISFVRSENGCPLCQCAIVKSPPIEQTSSCQKDVHCPPGFRCLNDARNVPMCQAVSKYNTGCSNDFGSKCDLKCPNGNYVLDDNGCPTCACVTECPQIKCRVNCGDTGYEVDENGCQTCKCKVKQNAQCSPYMCRMFCQYGFKRDENGCEYCACNESPQECPNLNCERSCSNGYRKDYSGCQTCECTCPALQCPDTLNCVNGLKKDADGCDTCTCEDGNLVPDYKDDDDDDDNDNNQDGTSDVKCPLFKCDLDCTHGYQRDDAGCQSCACNRCPLNRCRMFCMYGFRKNDQDGCELCECDWTPVAEKIRCDERISCPEMRVCNLNLRLCEAVKPDDVNWFTYDFEIKTDLFQDDSFVQTFKNGFIENVAAKYGFQPTQIIVSSVEANGLTSFQILPFFNEDKEIFNNKIDQIDIDLNSHEFRNVLPAVIRVIDEGTGQNPTRITIRTWCQKIRSVIRAKFVLFTALLLLAVTGLLFLIGFISVRRRYMQIPNRSESKAAIYDDASYHLGSTDDDYQAVTAPDGTKYVIVSTDDAHISKDKRVEV